MSAFVLFTNFRCRLWCSRTTGRIRNTSNITDIHPVYQGRLFVQKSLSLLKLIKKRFSRNNKRLLSKAVHYNTHKHDIMLFRIAWHKEEEAMSDSFGYWLPSSSNTFSRPKADSSITIAILTSIYVIYSELNENLNNVTHAQSSRTKWVIR